MRDLFFRVCCGVLLGIGAVAPGVSGTVIAMSMGVYDRLIGIMSNPFRGLKKNLSFILPVGTGSVAGAMGFLVLLKLIFDNAPVRGHMLFIGMVLGSIPVVLREMKIFKPHYALAGVLSAALAVFIALAGGPGESSAPSGIAGLSLCGAIAGAMSVIPGISVSMVLMILGVYTTMLDAILLPDVAVIAAVGVCFLSGMVLFSNVVKMVLQKYRVLAFYLVMGFLVGSVIGVAVELPHNAYEGVVQPALALVIGIGLCWLAQRVGRTLSLKPAGETENDDK